MCGHCRHSLSLCSSKVPVDQITSCPRLPRLSSGAVLGADNDSPTDTRRSAVGSQTPPTPTASHGQSVCEPCEFQTNVSTSEISISVCNYEFLNDFASEPRIFTLNLTCPTDCCTSPGNDSPPLLMTFPGLTPGNQYSFNILIDSNKMDTKIVYTKPERVSPEVSNRGTTDYIEVTWMCPPGNVEEYMVHLTSNFGDNQTKFLNSSFQSHLFSALTAGRNYTVTVTTISGPFAEESEPVSTATYPNPPGAIHAEEQTTDSITISWGWPQDMDWGQYSFIIFHQDHPNGQTLTSNRTVLANLTSGTLYNISLVTVGPMNYQSTAVTAEIYTNPNPPGAIHAEEQTTDSITISWGWPQDMDWGQYSFIIFYQDHPNGQTLTSNTTVLANLISGILYNISVVTIGPMNYQSTAVTAEIYTRPYPVLGLNATTINTTVVVLHWQRPQGYQPGYSFRVETCGCMPVPRNQIELDSMATVTGLPPGTNFSFTVYSQVQNSIEGEPISVYQYTKPERVSPEVSNRGTNDTIRVTWTPPLGNVEEYMVHLISNFGDNLTKFFNGSFQSHLFSGLTAGRNYTVIVTTISGPFAEESEPVSTATYPNPPGAIHAEEQTTDSITISWGWPQGMDWGQYSFIIFHQDHPNGQTLTSNRTVLANLTSGTLYNISLVTVGPMNYKSTAVTAEIYTRPYPVLGLNATTINTTVVVLHWQRPQGYQPGYSFRVETCGCMPVPRNQIELDSMATVTGLPPGTNFSFTVYSQVQNSIEGEPISVYQYTKPERVSPEVSNRGTNDTIGVTWTPPLGNVEEYMVHLTSNFGDNLTKFFNGSFQSHLFSGLTAGRNYIVTVTTISGPFAEESEPVSTATYPNPPGAIHAEEQTTDSITISWGWPQGMDWGQYSFIIFYEDHPNGQTLTSSTTVLANLTSGTLYNISLVTVGPMNYKSTAVTAEIYTSMDWGQYSFIIFYQDHPNGQTLTSNRTVLANLISGTLYNISMVTIGPMNYQSTAVTAEIYTRPYPVLGLNATTINTTVVVLHWQRPQGYEPGYSFRVETSGCMPVPRNQIELDSMATITGLPPGTNFSFTVYSQVQNSIEGEPISVYQYTKPERVNPEVSNRGMDWGQYSFIIFYQDHPDGQNLTSNTTVLANLTSGKLYNISLVTIGPMNYKSTAVTAEIYTRPYPVLGLSATTINTTVVLLHWQRPQGHQPGYSYRVVTSGCTSAPRTQIEENPMVTITGLNPGTNCSFTIYSQVQSAIEGEPISVYQYTKPERVSPVVSNRGTTDTIEVTWTYPPGNVEEYMVNLTGNFEDNRTKFLNSSFQSHLFSGLTAGRNYTVTVTTISGPFAEESEPVSTATYPNPPGAIHAEEQTTDSITISWGWPQGMDWGQYSFIIFYQDHPDGQNLTSNTTVLANLTSGKLYNISLVTIGPMNYKSTAVTAEIYTRPYPVLGLSATTINTTVVLLHWQRPQGHQPGYSYRVVTSGCTSAPRTQIEENPMVTITGLNPGTNCSFTIYSQVQSAIEGEPISVYQYTKPERVSPVVSNRGTTDTIEVTWTYPPGNVEEYMVNLTGNFEDNRTKFLNSSFQSHLFSGLTAGRNYTVTVTTISGPFAEESEPVSTATCEYDHQLKKIQSSST
ncbi:hypothetical protein SKAU_G00305430 [Synaphobranchus kaupii]|uniref:Fibronectin type-III domain-containing protein n=1 Tax=Synaphobranchus kaupii TaxID=118154 RepID=A0A9Q1EQU6_SYNKA|nr:hypothetical protein SKAU_G00305430 [Synaphobranchus kaupii]